MTFMLILGFLAAGYILWLLFRLAAMALPVFCAVGAGLWLIGGGWMLPAGLTGGLAAGLIVQLAGQWLAAMPSPAARMMAAATFAAPAAAAGYFATRGIAGIVNLDGGWLLTLSSIGSLVTACAAWRSLRAPFWEKMAAVDPCWR